MKTKFLAVGLPLMLVLSLPASLPRLPAVIAPQTTLDQDVFLFGQQVTLDGIVNGNALIIGDQVEINGSIDGSLFLIGQNIALNGQISGSTYALALTLDLGEQALLERDLYIATVSLTSAAGSIIGRDLFALGLDAGLNGQVGRALHTILGPIQLYNALMHVLGFDELIIRLRIETSAAPLQAYGRQPAAIGRGQGLGLFPAGLWSVEAPFPWQEWLLARLRLWLILAIFSLGMLWLLRPSLEASSQPARTTPWRTLGTGLVVLIAVINVFFLLLVLYLLVFALGLGLVYLGVWQVAVALWILTLCALGALAVAFWLFILYGAKVIACYALQAWLLARQNGSAPFWQTALALLVGALLYTLLRAIPYLGIVFDLLITALGAGAAWLAWLRRKRTARPRRRKAIEAPTPTAASS